MRYRRGPREMARYGLRGRRVGEAAHPGPPTEHRRDILDALHNFRHTPSQHRQPPPPEPDMRAATVQPAHSARSAVRLFASVSSAAAPALSSPSALQRIPGCIQRQRWSPVNTTIMWAAAASSETHPVIEWMASATSNAAQVEGAVFSRCEGIRIRSADQNPLR